MKVCFRFDIDTPCCLQQGVPALIRLADQLGVRFTFFFNPGRSITRGIGFAKKSHAATAPKLTPGRKLGIRELLRTALVNPSLHRLSRAGDLVIAQQSGHEIGLHGGRNHGRWHRQAHLWSTDEIRNEIEWGLSVFSSLGLDQVRSFASPGWNSSSHLLTLLPEYGIHVLADEHGRAVLRPDQECHGSVARVVTNHSGEPGGVGYLETSIASGQSSSQTVDAFIAELRSEPHLEHVVYDHPCFAGREALPLLRELILACRAEGAEFTTIGKIGERVLAAQGGVQS